MTQKPGQFVYLVPKLLSLYLNMHMARRHLLLYNIQANHMLGVIFIKELITNEKSKKNFVVVNFRISL